jgi:hypothetical protein
MIIKEDGQMSKRILFSVFAVALSWSTVIVFAQVQATKADYNWLNGKWEGAPPGGGTMQMDLNVDKGNQVKGSGHIVQPGSKRQTTRQIEGTVNGDKVELEFFAANNVIKYVLTFVDGTLQGTGNSPNQKGPVETIFKKVN